MDKPLLSIKGMCTNHSKNCKAFENVWTEHKAFFTIFKPKSVLVLLLCIIYITITFSGLT